ncbi:MAG: PKD domain-containing protein [Patescibacteria group bacterium]
MCWTAGGTPDWTANGWNNNAPRNGSGAFGPVTSTVTYTLYCENYANGTTNTVSDSVSVSTSGPPAPVVDLRCNGSTGPCVVLSGTNVTLSWTTANATTCTASNGWTGAKGLSGSESRGPITVPVTYTLTCNGVSDSVTVSPGAPTTVDLRCNNGTGLPFTDGPCSPPPGNFELQWTSANATTCTASRNPPATNWEGPVALTGAKLLSVPGGLRVYALTCTGASTAVDYVTVNPGINDAKFVSQSIPKTVLTTGETMNVSVTMQNCRPNNDCTGLSTWMDTANHRLGSQNPQDNLTWGFGRVLLPAGTSIPPGSSYTFPFTITAPAVAGNYNFQWRMLREAVEWFGDYTPNVSIAVNVPIPPVVSNVTANIRDYCTYGPGAGPGADISWTYSSGTPQSAYRIQIDDDVGFSNPNYDSGTVLNSNTSVYVVAAGLTWNTTYRARVMVWDGADTASLWTNQTICIGTGCNVFGTAWTTPGGPYPVVAFANIPAKPVAGQPTQFTDGSVCLGGGCQAWAWNFGDGGIDTVQNPVHTYALQGAYTVKLDVTDGNSNMCSITKALNANKAIPFWREVLPW